MDLDGRVIVRRSSLGARRRCPSRECVFLCICANAFSLGADSPSGHYQRI